MLGALVRAAKRSVFINFNQLERDRWVAGVAARIRPGQLLLDVGAGSSPYRHLFTHCVYRAQDFTRLEPAQLLGKSGYSAIDIVSEADAIPVGDASFDAILCTEVLEHVPEPIRVVKEFGRILRPGGLLILTAPLGSAIHQQPYHFYGGYTPYWYRRFLPEAGFTDIVIEANGGFYRHLSQELVRFCQLTSPWTLRAPIIGRVLWTPVWLASLAACAVFIPVLHALDRLDRREGFTVGYHVLARRAQ